MTHDSAVRIVVSLVPEIGKQGAESVLTKYASEQDLPPAQLEKLGQVYNTLRTVSHIDNAEEAARGSSVELLDVPNMVVGYATGMSQEKAANLPTSCASHDPATVDLQTALMADMQDPIEKAASDNLGELSQAAADYLITRADVDDAILDLQVDLENEMSKLASQIFTEAEQTDTWERDISNAEREALYLQPAPLVKLASDFMDKFAEPHHVTLTHHDFELPLAKRAYAIEDAAGAKFAELAKVVGTYDMVEKIASGVMADELAESPDDQSLDGDILNALAAVPTMDPERADSEKKEKGEADAEEKAEEKQESATDKLKGNPDLAATHAGEKADAEKGNPNAGKGDGGEGGGGGGGKGGGGKGTEKSTKEKGVSGAAVLGAVSAPVKAVGGAIRGAATKADETLTNITTKERRNKAQKATDVSVEDIKRAMNLRRMIGTDPVLKEADPTEVLEVYNAIAQKNPDIANDMASLRLILREAVTYEGLTLDSQKMLSETRRNSEQAEQLANENDKKRYAVGGASPLQLTSK